MSTELRERVQALQCERNALLRYALLHPPPNVNIILPENINHIDELDLTICPNPLPTYCAAVKAARQFQECTAPTSCSDNNHFITNSTYDYQYNTYDTVSTNNNNCYYCNGGNNNNNNSNNMNIYNYTNECDMNYYNNNNGSNNASYVHSCECHTGPLTLTTTATGIPANPRVDFDLTKAITFVSAGCGQVARRCASAQQCVPCTTNNTTCVKPTITTPTSTCSNTSSCTTAASKKACKKKEKEEKKCKKKQEKENKKAVKAAKKECHPCAETKPPCEENKPTTPNSDNNNNTTTKTAATTTTTTATTAIVKEDKTNEAGTKKTTATVATKTTSAAPNLTDASVKTAPVATTSTTSAVTKVNQDTTTTTTTNSNTTAATVNPKEVPLTAPALPNSATCTSSPPALALPNTQCECCTNTTEPICVPAATTSSNGCYIDNANNTPTAVTTYTMDKYGKTHNVKVATTTTPTTTNNSNNNNSNKQPSVTGGLLSQLYNYVIDRFANAHKGIAGNDANTPNTSSRITDRQHSHLLLQHRHNNSNSNNNHNHPLERQNEYNSEEQSQYNTDSNNNNNNNINSVGFSIRRPCRISLFAAPGRNIININNNNDVMNNAQTPTPTQQQQQQQYYEEESEEQGSSRVNNRKYHHNNNTTTNNNNNNSTSADHSSRSQSSMWLPRNRMTIPLHGQTPGTLAENIIIPERLPPWPEFSPIEPPLPYKIDACPLFDASMLDGFRENFGLVVYEHLLMVTSLLLGEDRALYESEVHGVYGKIYGLTFEQHMKCLSNLMKPNMRSEMMSGNMEIDLRKYHIQRLRFDESTLKMLRRHSTDEVFTKRVNFLLHTIRHCADNDEDNDLIKEPHRKQNDAREDESSEDLESLSEEEEEEEQEEEEQEQERNKNNNNDITKTKINNNVYEEPNQDKLIEIIDESGNRISSSSEQYQNNNAVITATTVLPDGTVDIINNNTNTNTNNNNNLIVESAFDGREPEVAFSAATATTTTTAAAVAATNSSNNNNNNNVDNDEDKNVSINNSKATMKTRLRSIKNRRYPLAIRATLLAGALMPLYIYDSKGHEVYNENDIVHCVTALQEELQVPEEMIEYCHLHARLIASNEMAHKLAVISLLQSAARSVNSLNNERALLEAPLSPLVKYAYYVLQEALGMAIAPMPWIDTFTSIESRSAFSAFFMETCLILPAPFLIAFVLINNTYMTPSIQNSGVYLLALLSLCLGSATIRTLASSQLTMEHIIEWSVGELFAHAHPLDRRLRQYCDLLSARSLPMAATLTLPTRMHLGVFLLLRHWHVGEFDERTKYTIEHVAHGGVAEMTHLALVQQLNTMRIPSDFSAGVSALLNFLVRVLPEEWFVTQTASESEEQQQQQQQKEIATNNNSSNNNSSNNNSSNNNNGYHTRTNTKTSVGATSTISSKSGNLLHKSKNKDTHKPRSNYSCSQRYRKPHRTCLDLNPAIAKETEMNYILSLAAAEHLLPLTTLIERVYVALPHHVAHQLSRTWTWAISEVECRETSTSLMHIFYEAIHHKLPMPLTHTPLITYHKFLKCFIQIVYRVLEPIRIAMPHSTLPRALPRITALSRRLLSFTVLNNNTNNTTFENTNTTTTTTPCTLTRMDVLGLIHRINTLEEVEMEFESVFSQVHVAHVQIRLITGCTAVSIEVDESVINNNNNNNNNYNNKYNNNNYNNNNYNNYNNSIDNDSVKGKNVILNRLADEYEDRLHSVIAQDRNELTEQLAAMLLLSSPLYKMMTEQYMKTDAKVLNSFRKSYAKSEVVHYKRAFPEITMEVLLKELQCTLTDLTLLNDPFTQEEVQNRVGVFFVALLYCVYVEGEDILLTSVEADNILLELDKVESFFAECCAGKRKNKHKNSTSNNNSSKSNSVYNGTTPTISTTGENNAQAKNGNNDDDDDEDEDNNNVSEKYVANIYSLGYREQHVSFVSRVLRELQHIVRYVMSQPSVILVNGGPGVPPLANLPEYVQNSPWCKYMVREILKHRRDKTTKELFEENK